MFVPTLADRFVKRCHRHHVPGILLSWSYRQEHHPGSASTAGQAPQGHHLGSADTAGQAPKAKKGVPYT
eukprot:3189089-Heterocapsa_arctica.AAC.1